MSILVQVASNIFTEVGRTVSQKERDELDEAVLRDIEKDKQVDWGDEDD